MVTAYQGDQVDAIIQFDILSGKTLLDDPNFNAIAAPAALHRQIWMRTDKGQFADKRVRQALALTFDRPASSSSSSRARPSSGNDHPIWEGYPYFDSTVPQRTQDIDKAKALLADAGASNLTATLHAGQLLEIPDLATLLKSQAAQAGITLNVAVESLDTFYGAQWCPADPADPPCSGAAELGIVDYGHRGTPDVYLNAALKCKGIWNSSQYGSTAFDDAFKAFQTAVGVDAQKAACNKMETILVEDTADRPAVLLQLPRRQLEEVQRAAVRQRARPDVLLGGLEGRLTSHHVRPVDGPTGLRLPHRNPGLR